MRRTLLATVVVFFAIAPAALAQLPVPPDQQPPPTPPPTLQPANVVVSVVGPRLRARTYAVAGTLVRVLGHMNKAASGDRLAIDLYRGATRVKRTHAIVNAAGKFRVDVRARTATTFTVQAVHSAGSAVAAGDSKRVAFVAVAPNMHVGSRGPAVQLLQRQLALLAYVTPRGGHYDDATGRAVLAYRKVNRMSRVTNTNRDILTRLFEGRGGFRLRYPRAGKHVEADLSRQVLVLARNGRAERIYTTSSGKPSTPTVVGTFRFYLRGPGYNSEGMYFSTYFIRGYAVHGYHDVPPYNASHGCLRVPLSDALSIYRWISLGDRIFVYQRGRGSTRVMPNAGP